MCLSGTPGCRRTLVTFEPVLTSLLVMVLKTLLMYLRSKQMYLILVRRSNFEPLLLLLQRLYGFDSCYLILAILVKLPHVFSMIIQKPYNFQ
jgi:hypothetical protein